MRNRKLVLGLAVAGVILLPGCGEKSTARTHRIEIKGMVYALPELTVAPGDAVVWVNGDIVPHTVTSDTGRFDSGSLSPSAEWLLVVRDRGRLPYSCTFHPTMKAALVVK
jgi:plastocyanin